MTLSKKNKSVHFVTHHHEVLSVWAKHRRGRQHASRLLTLDHHTDTSSPFRNHLKKQFPGLPERQQLEREELLKAIDFTLPQTVDDAVRDLSHDEHILTALKTDILSTACVVAHNAQDTQVQTLREHQVICFSVDRKPSEQRLQRQDCDRVLETSFLQAAVQHFDDVFAQDQQPSLLAEGYILDLDLDYFNTHRSTQPQDRTFFQKLFRHADLITVATEPEYVQKCAWDKDLTSQQIWSSLESWIYDDV